MPDRLELSEFEPHVGDPFTIDGTDGSSIGLTLTEAKRGPWQPEGEGETAFAFELTFRGPRQPLLPQATYRMTHPSLGAVGIFVVPLSQDDDGTTYQAVFS